MKIEPNEFLNLAHKSEVGQTYEDDPMWDIKAKKIINYFYDNHPVKGLLRNKQQDMLVLKRILESVSFKDAYGAVKYMHMIRKVDFKNIQYVLNEAIQYNTYVNQKDKPNTAGYLVDYFYSLYDFQFYSPNFVRECALIDLNLETHCGNTIKSILKLMHGKHHTDLRMFNYVRNEYLSKNNNNQYEYEEVIGDYVFS